MADERPPEPGESESEQPPVGDESGPGAPLPAGDAAGLGEHRSASDAAGPGDQSDTEDAAGLGEDRSAGDAARPGDQRGADDGTGPAKRAALCRSASDRVLAGVAGGIGTYFGIDPVIVRIGFIVLTFMGGAGPFLYLVGWLALPRETSGSIVTDVLGGDAPHRFRSLVAVVLIGFGLMVTAMNSGNLFALFVSVWSIAPYLALLLIAAGVALVLWPGPTTRPKSTPARPPAPAAFTPPAPPPPAAAGPERGASSGALAVPAAGAPSESPAKRSQRRPRSVVGPITVAALLVFTGGAMLLGRLDVLDIEIAAFLAIALAITGAGLVVSAFAGRARGLILLGVALAGPLVLFAGSDALWGAGIGERRVRITDAADLEDQYHHGIGRLVVDLRDLQPDGRAHSVDINLGVGEVLVYVPDNIFVVGNADVGAGAIREYYEGPARSDRTRDLLDIRGTLGYLLSLEFEGDNTRDGVEDYMEAFRDFHRSRGIPFPGGEENPIFHLLPELLADRAGEASPRDLMNDLLIEAHNIMDEVPVDDVDSGLSLSRSFIGFLDGEPAGELQFDIDVGVGRSQIVTLRARPGQEVPSP